MDDKLNAALKGIYDALTDEQKAKAKQCKTMDELTLLAGREGVELPDEALDMVAGGGCGDDDGDTQPSDDGPHLPREVPAAPKADTLSDNPFH